MEGAGAPKLVSAHAPSVEHSEKSTARCITAVAQHSAFASPTVTQLPEGMPHEVIHRDDLVVLP